MFVKHWEGTGKIALKINCSFLKNQEAVKKKVNNY